jgi:uncharacterized RDD family membrane protein YckC
VAVLRLFSPTGGGINLIFRLQVAVFLVFFAYRWRYYFGFSPTGGGTINKQILIDKGFTLVFL